MQGFVQPADDDYSQVAPGKANPAMRATHMTLNPGDGSRSDSDERSAAGGSRYVVKIKDGGNLAFYGHAASNRDFDAESQLQQ